MRALVWCSLLLLAPSTTWAQERPRAAILETQAAGNTGDTAGAVDRMIRARLDNLEVVETAGGVALDLGEVQLALGCVGETAECLAPVADELSVRLLVIPQLDRTDDELMLSIAVFDREDGSIDRAVRRAGGERARADLLDAIDGQLRELFGLPALPPPEEPVTTQPQPPAPSGPGAGSFVVMGAGAVALAVGAGLGVAFLDAHGEWQDARPTTSAEVDAAEDAFARAESFAIAADVLFVAGGLALAGGLTWLLVELLGAPSSGDTTSISPIVGPALAGLAVSGEWQ